MGIIGYGAEKPLRLVVTAKGVIQVKQPTRPKADTLQFALSVTIHTKGISYHAEQKVHHVASVHKVDTTRHIN